MGILTALSAAFTSAKWVIIGALVTAAMSAIGLLYWQNVSLRNDNAVLQSNQAKLEAAVNTQKDTISEYQKAVAEWKASADNMQKNLKAMSKMQSDASSEIRRLRDVYSKHDLRALSIEKPALVEDSINNGTSDILGRLRDETN